MGTPEAHLQMFHTIFETLGSPDEIKDALRKQFGGSLEEPAKICQLYEVERGGEGTHEDGLPPWGFFVEVLFNRLRLLYQLDHWEQRAKEDQKSCIRELDAVLNSVRTLMHSWCGIYPNRPQENQSRDDLVFQLRQQGRSFGGIAKELQKYGHRLAARQGHEVARKQAATIYKKRCEQYVDDFIRQSRKVFKVVDLLNDQEAAALKGSGGKLKVTIKRKA